MKKSILVIVLLAMISCKEETSKSTPTIETTPEVAVTATTKKGFEIIPVSHATTILNWDGVTIYVDPVGGPELFDSYPKPDLILITDIHGDHLNVKTLEGLETSEVKMIVPEAVAKKMPENFAPQLDILNNGESKEHYGFTTTAIPMYNLREEALKFHSKGRGNGYVIEKDGKRVYFSGDTEDVPEMRALKNIDVAFICMNLPYTMTEESAASAVLEFKPKKVYPYHYRGTEGLSDVVKFKDIVTKGDPAIEVVQLDWYAAQKQ